MPEFVPGFTQPSAGDGPHGGLLMAQALKDNGVDTIFALCGGHILGLLDGCLELGIRVVDTRHEGAATLAAEGWALATGRTGVAAVTAGPGFANSLTGFIDAGVWSVPLMLFAGRTGLTQRGRGAVMDVDQRAIVAPVAKWAEICHQTERIPRYVGAALATARAGKPGPAYLEIPQDVFMASAPASALDEEIGGFPRTGLAPAPDAESLERGLEALQKAERPLILAGSGAFWSDAGEEIARFAEQAQIPVITTSAARGVVADSHPWCLGSLVHAGVALPAADVVLLLGSAFNANVMYGGPPLWGLGQTVIQVDIEPAQIGGNRNPDVGIVGDVAATVREFADAWRKTPSGRDAWLQQGRDAVAFARATWDAQIDAHAGDRVHAGAMAREVCAFAAEVGDATIAADGGDALTWALACAHAEKPGRVLTTTTALGTLGVGLPFSIAAAAARPGEPVFCVMGDGSFGLCAMEIDTAVRHGLPVIVIVSNNTGWRDVSHEQDAWYGKGRRVASELGDSRYDKIAEAFGGHGEHVTSIDELRPALRRSLDSGVASVINVQTDPEVLSELLRNLGQLGLM